MFFKKKSVWCTALIIAFLFTAYIVFSGNIDILKESINVSLQEDFKIKESLGQVFFLFNEDETNTVSSSVTVTSMEKPCSGEIEQKEFLGEKYIVIYATEFESVSATADGIIESCENSKITLRHYDGKLSNYFGAVCLVKKGDRVKKGDTIGYAKGEIAYKLYENCVAIDPLEYLS